MKAWFVTGTDTSVGKTTVAVALLRALAARGLRTVAMKPAESGCETRRGWTHPTLPAGEPLAGEDLVPADAVALAEAATTPADLGTVCPYRFAEPVAPGVAAAREGVRIELAAIRRRWETLASGADVGLVEGAGGLLVPLADEATIADLAVALALPLLVVARPDLGTINHTLLTLEAARARRLGVAGVVFSDPRGCAARMAASNQEEIARLGGVPVLGVVPRLAGGAGSVEASAARLAAALLDG